MKLLARIILLGGLLLLGIKACAECERGTKGHEVYLSTYKVVFYNFNSGKSLMVKLPLRGYPAYNIYFDFEEQKVCLPPAEDLLNNK